MEWHCLAWPPIVASEELFWTAKLIVSSPCSFSFTTYLTKPIGDLVGADAAYLLKYLIRRTDITLLVNNLRSGLTTGRINPAICDMIEYILDYTLGLVECTREVEHLSPILTKTLQWLILSYGGARTWHRFAQIVQQGIKAATKTIETRRLELLNSTDLEAVINSLELYSTMLLGRIDCDRHGGPALDKEDEEFRSIRRHIGRTIPTTNSERLAFRLERALRELKKVRDSLVNHCIHPGGRDDGPQIQPKAEVHDNGPLPDSSHNSANKNSSGTSMIPECSIMSNVSATAGGVYSGFDDEPSILDDNWEVSSVLTMSDMREKIDEILDGIWQLQEKLPKQRRNENGDGNLATGIQPETSQEHKQQSDSEANPVQTSLLKIGSDVENTVNSEREVTKTETVLAVDTSFSVPSPSATGGMSPSGSYIALTPPSGGTPSNWSSGPFPDRDVPARSPNHLGEDRGRSDKPENTWPSDIEW